MCRLIMNLGVRQYVYRKISKYMDRKVWAHSVDQDQTAPTGAVWSGSTLFAISFASFGCIIAFQKQIVPF